MTHGIYLDFLSALSIVEGHPSLVVVWGCRLNVHHEVGFRVTTCVRMCVCVYPVRASITYAYTYIRTPTHISAYFLTPMTLGLTLILTLTFQVIFIRSLTERVLKQACQFAVTVRNWSVVVFAGVMVVGSERKTMNR